MRQQEVVEVGDIIPHGELCPGFLPCLQIFQESGVVRVARRLKRFGEVRLNGAQQNADVFPRHDSLWRSAGILIGKGLHFNAGKLFLHMFRNEVDERDHGGGRRLSRLVDFFTFQALTVVVVVVLGNGNDLRVRIFPEFLPDNLQKFLPEFRIAQAELSLKLTACALSVAQTEVFRVGF